MRVAFAVMPRLLMAVAATRRDKFVQDLRKVALQSWFEFNRTHGGRTADAENVYSARADTRIAHNGDDIFREVVHVAVAGSMDCNLLFLRHNLLPFPLQPWCLAVRRYLPRN